MWNLKLKNKWAFFLCSIIILKQSSTIFAKTFRPEPGKPVGITAGRVVYKWEIKKLLLECSNNIRPTIKYEKRFLISDLMIYDDNIKKGFAFGNVYYEDKEENIILTANEGTYDENSREITLTKNPKILMKKENTTAKSEIIKIYPEKELVYLIGNVIISNTNFIVTGRRAQLDQKSKKLRVTDNVIITSPNEGKLYAERFTIDSTSSGSQNYTADGGVKVEDKKEGYIIYGNRLDYLKGENYMRITGGYSNLYERPTIIFTNKDIVASSIVMEKYDNENKANLLGNVEIIQGNRKATSRWAEYFISRKEIILTGNPVLEEEESKFFTSKIIVNIEKQSMNMSGKGRGKYLLRKSK